MILAQTAGDSLGSLGFTAAETRKVSIPHYQWVLELFSCRDWRGRLLNLLRTDTAGESWVLLRVYSSRDIRWELGLLKGYTNEADFWGFCRNWFLMSPLHYLSSRSNFSFDFAEIFVFEKRLPAITDGESPTPRITDTRSRQLPASLIHGVGDSPHHRYGESAIDIFKRKLSVTMIRRVVNSPHQ